MSAGSRPAISTPRGARSSGFPNSCRRLPRAMTAREKPMPWPSAVTLTGAFARLELLSQDHRAGLIEAVKDGELWRLWYTTVPAPDTMKVEIDRRLALRRAGSMLPFAVIDLATGHPTGMTTYMNIDSAQRRVEIGSTWYRKSVQRSPINTECKLLLLATRSRPGLHRGGVPHPFLQSAEPARDRAARGQARRRAAQPPALKNGSPARHLRLFDHRRRMAGGPANLMWRLERPRIQFARPPTDGLAPIRRR